jgi:hypothetical protein
MWSGRFSGTSQDASGRARSRRRADGVVAVLADGVRDHAADLEIVLAVADHARIVPQKPDVDLAATSSDAGFRLLQCGLEIVHGIDPDLQRNQIAIANS